MIGLRAQISLRPAGWLAAQESSLWVLSSQNYCLTWTMSGSLPSITLMFLFSPEVILLPNPQDRCVCIRILRGKRNWQADKKFITAGVCSHCFRKTSITKQSLNPKLLCSFRQRGLVRWLKHKSVVLYILQSDWLFVVRDWGSLFPRREPNLPNL